MHQHTEIKSIYTGKKIQMAIRRKLRKYFEMNTHV